MLEKRKLLKLPQTITVFFDTPKAVSGFIPVFDVTYRHIQLAKTRMTNRVELNLASLCPQKHTCFSHFMLTFRTRCPDTSWQETMKIDESWSISRGSYKYRCLPDPSSRRENWERIDWPFNSQLVYPKLTSLGHAKKVIPIKKYHPFFAVARSPGRPSHLTFQGTVKEDKATGRMMLQVRVPVSSRTSGF